MKDVGKIELTATPAPGKPGRFLVVAIADGKTLNRDTISLDSALSRGKFVGRTLAVAFLDTPADDWPEGVREQLHADLMAFAAAPPGSPATPPDPAPEDLRPAALAEMAEDVRAEAAALLENPKLVEVVSDHIRRAGAVGEEELTLALYLIGTSVQLPRPLAAIVRGPSSSGKSHVVDVVSGLFPPEVVLRATSITTNALYYFPPGTLRHRWVVAGERSRREDDDTAEATRALREMIEAGRLSKAVPVRNDDGRTVTELVEQEGPIGYVETTTLGTIFAEDANRCLLLQTDEREEQTRKVLEAIGAAAGGRAPAGDLDRLRLVHHALQRMLPRCEVIVPFGPAVAALFPETRIDARRNIRYLIRLVQASALLHFKQRKRDRGRVVADGNDYCLAAKLAKGPLGNAAGGLADGASRFFDRLKKKFPDKEFTTTEARKGEKSVGKSTIHGWLGELADHGAVEQTKPSKGRVPATWMLTAQGVVQPSGIPTWDEVYKQHSARTHGRKAD